MGLLKSYVANDRSSLAVGGRQVELEFQRGGQTIYKSINFIGYVRVSDWNEAAVAPAVVGRGVQHGRTSG